MAADWFHLLRRFMSASRAKTGSLSHQTAGAYLATREASPLKTIPKRKPMFSAIRLVSWPQDAARLVHT